MENVTKRFGKVVANNAINLELHEGEILSLLGENGSGKTTLMNMLSGIYFPDYQTQIPQVIAAVQSGEIAESDIDAHVFRVLHEKQALGLIN